MPQFINKTTEIIFDTNNKALVWVAKQVDFNYNEWKLYVAFDTEDEARKWARKNMNMEGVEIEEIEISVNEEGKVGIMKTLYKNLFPKDQEYKEGDVIDSPYDWDIRMVRDKGAVARIHIEVNIEDFDIYETYCARAKVNGQTVVKKVEVLKNGYDAEDLEEIKKDEEDGNTKGDDWGTCDSCGRKVHKAFSRVFCDTLVICENC